MLRSTCVLDIGMTPLKFWDRCTNSWDDSRATVTTREKVPLPGFGVAVEADNVKSEKPTSLQVRRPASTRPATIEIPWIEVPWPQVNKATHRFFDWCPPFKSEEESIEEWGDRAVCAHQAPSADGRRQRLEREKFGHLARTGQGCYAFRLGETRRGHARRAPPLQRRDVRRAAVHLVATSLEFARVENVTAARETMTHQPPK